MRVTILTGYPVFDYAQKAIEMGVTRYLVKPSKFELIEEALAAMVKELDRISALPPEPPVAEPEPTPSQEEEPPRPEPVQDEVVSLENSQNFIIRNAIRYMEEHYNEKITLLDVAEHVYVSQWHLSKLIAKNTNQSFSDILNSIRVQKAKELLMNPALRIWEISDMVGFGDVSHFSRIFKKYENMSANEYRNQLPEQDV